jgi:hypothetical protein
VSIEQASTERWHYWWLQPDGTWGAQRGQASEVHMVPESQLRDHLPTGCRCGAAYDAMADGALRITHQLYGPDRYATAGGAS